MTIKGLSSRVLGLVLTCSLLLTINADAADVLIVGDSMMKAVARALKKECAKRTLSTETLTSIGSGLARLDLLDWHQYKKILGTGNDTIVTCRTKIGYNDRQVVVIHIYGVKQTCILTICQAQATPITTLASTGHGCSGFAGFQTHVVRVLHRLVLATCTQQTGHAFIRLSGIDTQVCGNIGHVIRSHYRAA